MMRLLILWWRLFLFCGWPPTLVFVIHAVASLGLGLYHSYPNLDIPMHFFGGVVIAFFFARCVAAFLLENVASSARSLHHALMTFGFVGTTTGLWEFAEFAYDWLFQSHAQLSLDDTLLDMALGMIGGLAYLGAARYAGSLGRVVPGWRTEFGGIDHTRTASKEVGGNAA